MSDKISRRKFLNGMLLSSGAVLLAACGQQAPAAPEETTPAEEAPAATAPATVEETGSTVNVVYWGSFSGSLGEAETAMVERFNESQSDVRVEYQFQGNYEETAQKYTAGLQANTIPDLVLLSDVWWFSFYVSENIVALDELAAAEGVDFSDYEPVLLNEGVRQGQHFWIPFARSTPLFYYNKDIWAEAGLPDRAPETWAEFEEWVPDLVVRSGDTLERAAFVHPNGASYIAWLFQGVTWQHGGQYSREDFTMTMTDENTIRAGQFYQDMVVAKNYAILSADINQEFLGGTAAAMMASTGGLAGISENATFNVGVGFLPKETNFGCCTGGAGLAIPAGIPAEKQQAAMKYVAFATNTENAAIWSQSTGYMPVSISAVQSESMQSFFEENPNFRTAVEQLPLTRAQDAARVFVRNGDQIIGRGLERIIVNEEDVATVFAAVNDELADAATPILEDLELREG